MNITMDTTNKNEYMKISYSSCRIKKLVQPKNPIPTIGREKDKYNQTDFKMRNFKEMNLDVNASGGIP